MTLKQFNQSKLAQLDKKQQALLNAAKAINWDAIPNLKEKHDNTAKCFNLTELIGFEEDPTRNSEIDELYFKLMDAISSSCDEDPKNYDSIEVSLNESPASQCNNNTIGPTLRLSAEEYSAGYFVVQDPTELARMTQRRT